MLRWMRLNCTCRGRARQLLAKGATSSVQGLGRGLAVGLSIGVERLWLGKARGR